MNVQALGRLFSIGGNLEDELTYVGGDNILLNLSGSIRKVSLLFISPGNLPSVRVFPVVSHKDVSSVCADFRLLEINVNQFSLFLRGFFNLYIYGFFKGDDSRTSAAPYF